MPRFQSKDIDKKITDRLFQWVEGTNRHDAEDQTR